MKLVAFQNTKKQTEIIQTDALINKSRNAKRKNFLLEPLHCGLFCINSAHFEGNFWELEESKEGQKMVGKSAKRAKKDMKGVRKVQKYHETVKIGPKIIQ